MHRIERLCINLRHAPVLEQADWFWDGVRPRYNGLVTLLGRNGLVRVINGTDELRVLAEFRVVAESYEPEVWKHLMARVRAGDHVADIGACIGLYSIALANRVGATGRVAAFEPDPENFAILKSHCRLNGLNDRIALIQAAVSDKDGTGFFEGSRSSESRLCAAAENGKIAVRCTRLDTVFADRRLDLLKIDVEGWEEAVLRGGMTLLQDRQRRPRLIYIEVHPYAWPDLDTTSESLLDVLRSCGYQPADLYGKPVTEIRAYGEIVASAASPHRQPMGA